MVKLSASMGMRCRPTRALAGARTASEAPLLVRPVSALLGLGGTATGSYLPTERQPSSPAIG